MLNPSVLVLNDTRCDRHYGCDSVIGAISKLLDKNGFKNISFWPAHREWRNNAIFDRLISDSDLVLVNGEGTIHHNKAEGKRLLEIGGRAKREGVPAALINAGWEANGEDFVQLLGDFDIVTARDGVSAKRMGSGKINVSIVPDLSLWFAQSQGFSPVSNHGRSGVGVTDNVDRFKALRLENIRSVSNSAMVSIAYGETGVSGCVRFIRDGISLSEDIIYPARLASLIGLRYRHWRQPKIDANGFISRLANLELLVSGRFHACTLALAAGTPLVALPSNTDKISALFGDVGLDKWRCTASINPDLLGYAKEYGWRQTEFSNICDYLRYASMAAERLFSDLAKLAQS